MPTNNLEGIFQDATMVFVLFQNSNAKLVLFPWLNTVELVGQRLRLSLGSSGGLFLHACACTYTCI